MNKKYKKLLWLDDVRDPDKDDWLNFSPIQPPFEYYWVKSYDEFVEWIEKNGLPDGIAFDHDLAYDQYAPESVWHSKHEYEKWKDGQNFKEKTGMDCAKWLISHCIDNNLKLPVFSSHSANPSGRENILSVLNNFKKFQDKN